MRKVLGVFEDYSQFVVKSLELPQLLAWVIIAIFATISGTISFATILACLSKFYPMRFLQI